MVKFTSDALASENHGRTLGQFWATHGQPVRMDFAPDDCLATWLVKPPRTMLKCLLSLAQMMGHQRRNRNACSSRDLARLTRFERATPAFGGQYSIQLSYRRFGPHCMARAKLILQRTRRNLRRAVLYPAELRARRRASRIAGFVPRVHRDPAVRRGLRGIIRPLHQAFNNQ